MNNDLPPIFSQKNCKKFKFAPVLVEGSVKKVLISDEFDSNLLSVIDFNLGYRPEYILSSLAEVELALNQSNQSLGVDSNITIDRISDSIITIVDEIVSEAIGFKASDIHIEPFETSYLIRYRLDGVLQEKRTLSKDYISPVVSRIKILSGLDIAEKRRPQDGRMRFEYQGNTVDIRVSVLPTDFGEKIVLRILDKSTLRLDLSLLGFKEEDLNLFRQKISLPYGIILITGPTGSGKTTTLYAALNTIKSPGINITTIEDPIEYNLPGINQTQIRPEINLTFASALRAILRQDPNVIMVGEIRDEETLENALRASLTGHLVFSTLHTNDAFSAIARLKDLGADDSILQSTLKLIVAQRLIRKCCNNCKTSDVPENERAAARALGVDPEAEKFAGRGCEKCMNIGYWGRTAIFEMLPLDINSANLIYSAKNYKEALALAGNKTSLREAGVTLIRSGSTTPSEVLRETE